ncbi:MAG: cupin domain-containing protein [Acidobacteriota bacterium]|nr:cupin domain-containing protein [Acidobacteriota bacterium]
MSGHAVREIDGMESLHGGAVKLAGAELGVESFGMQVLDFPAGFDGYPEHDHSEDGQEEVYVVLRGSAEFLVDGERVQLEPGRMLRVGAGIRRRLEPGAGGVRILAIGATPGRLYERPEDFRLAVGS